MQFRLRKQIKNGRYFVDIELTEYTDLDRAKSIKFGVPHLSLKLNDGRDAKVPITTMNKVPPYGFYTQEEAEQYNQNLKNEVLILKKEWNSLEDSWSDEEIL